jgi:hypothetical protein
VLAGGAGGAALAPASPGTPGATLVVDAGSTEEPSALARAFHHDAVVRDGTPVVITYQGQPFDLVWQILAFDANPLAVYLHSALGAIHPGGTPFLFKFRGLLNAVGLKTLNPTPSATSLDFVPLWEQALLYNDAEGFVASNPQFVAFLDAGVSSAAGPRTALYFRAGPSRPRRPGPLPGAPRAETPRASRLTHWTTPSRHLPDDRRRGYGS